jgi:hypothetical protein
MDFKSCLGKREKMRYFEFKKDNAGNWFVLGSNGKRVSKRKERATIKLVQGQQRAS